RRARPLPQPLPGELEPGLRRHPGALPAPARPPERSVVLAQHPPDRPAPLLPAAASRQDRPAGKIARRHGDLSPCPEDFEPRRTRRTRKEQKRKNILSCFFVLFVSFV